MKYGESKMTEHDFVHRGVKVLVGNSLTRLRELPDESANTCVTSPPYWGLRDYGGENEVWGGDSDCEHEWEHYTRQSENTRNNDNSLQLKSAYWDAQEQGHCKHCDAWWGQLGLEPTPELYVENLVLIFREVKRVLTTDGSLWLNLGDSYWAGNTHPILKPKDIIGIPFRVAFALQADGWWLRQDIIWAKPNCMPEPVKDRCTKSHEHIFLLTKSQNYYFDSEAIKERAVTKSSSGNDCTDTRLTYGVGGGNTGLKDLRKKYKKDGLPTHRNKRSVWWVSPKPFKGAHFAVYPPELIEPCILAGCPEGGIVLDPFGGSGTTGAVAIKHDREAVLIELSAEYAKLMPKRIDTLASRTKIIEAENEKLGITKASFDKLFD